MTSVMFLNLKYSLGYFGRTFRWKSLKIFFSLVFVLCLLRWEDLIPYLDPFID